MTRSRVSPRFPALVLGVIGSLYVSPSLLAQEEKVAPPELRTPTMQKIDIADERPSNVSTDNLPSGQQVIDTFVKAIGGENAIRKHTSVHIKGTMEDFTSNATMPFEIHRAAPDRMLMVVQRPQGTRSGGYNGVTTWANDAAVGPQVFGPPQPDALANFDFYRDLNYAKNFESFDVVSREDFDGRPCYRMRIVTKGGKEQFEFYDVETGLRAGTSVTRSTRQGKERTVDVLDDYKEFDGLKLPTRVATKSWGRGRQGTLVQMMVYESVEFGKVDPATFELPPEVQSAWQAELKAQESQHEEKPEGQQAPK